MKAPKQNCPRCEAVQSFRPQARDTPTPAGKVIGTPAVIEIYIRCTVCRWEQVLRKSTLEIERMQVNERRLLEQARVQHVRHGTANGATTRLLANVRASLTTARQEAGL